MVHVRDLDDDYYVYDETTYTLSGRRSGRQFRLGDAIDVQVVRVNPEERQIDFRILGAPDTKKASKTAKRRR